jgi:hypothetical protein
MRVSRCTISCGTLAGAGAVGFAGAAGVDGVAWGGGAGAAAGAHALNNAPITKPIAARLRFIRKQKSPEGIFTFGR